MNLRYATRTLLRTPGFTALAILTLAIGIGINTVVFAIFESVVMKPIAAHAPGELVRITGNQDGRDLSTFSSEQFSQMRTQTSTLAAVIASFWERVGLLAGYLRKVTLARRLRLGPK